MARSAALTYGANVAASVLSLCSVLITSKVLGAEGRGQVALLTAVAYLTSQLASLGLQQATANLAGRNPLVSPRLLTNAGLLSIAFGCSAACAVGLLIAVFPSAGGGTSTGLRVAVLCFVPLLIFQTCVQYLVQAHYDFVTTNLAWIVTPTVTVVVNGGMAARGDLTVGSAVAGWLVGQALATAILVMAAWSHTGGFGPPDRRLASEMLSFGMRAHLGRAMLVGNYRMDQWILGSLAGPRALGTYSVAVAWSEALFFLPTALSAVLRPDLVRAGESAAREQAAAVFRYAVLLTIPVAAGLIILAPVLCVSAFGPEFGPSVTQLRILAVGAPGIVALKILGGALTAQRRPLLETAAIGTAFLTILVLDLALIPRHGALGASIAATVAYSVGGIAAGWIFVRALGGTMRRDLSPSTADVSSLLRSRRGGPA